MRRIFGEGCYTKKMKKIIVTFIVVLLLIVIGLEIYIISQSQKEPSDNSSPPATEEEQNPSEEAINNVKIESIDPAKREINARAGEQNLKILVSDETQIFGSAGQGTARVAKTLEDLDAWVKAGANDPLPPAGFTVRGMWIEGGEGVFEATEISWTIG